jgi:hypothetical protein
VFAGGDVHGVADDVVVIGAHDHLARVDSYPQRDVDPALAFDLPCESSERDGHRERQVGWSCKPE